MSQVVNWICLTSVSLLVIDIMIYFCKDSIKILNESKNKVKSNRIIEKSEVDKTEYVYQTPIAK